jgi:hypothetical protein
VDWLTGSFQPVFRSSKCECLDHETYTFGWSRPRMPLGIGPAPDSASEVLGER